MRALLDFAAIVIFIVAALAFFSFSWTAPPASASCWPLTWQAFAIVQGAYLVSRFFLAPRASALRFLPFTDETALYLHRWLHGPDGGSQLRHS